MAQPLRDLSDFLSLNGPVIRVTLRRVRGSSPRDEGTEMFVAQDRLWSTIGGGQLEYIAIDRAREMLRKGVLNLDLDVPLGPEIGQCCGGRVELSLARMRPSDKREALTHAQDQAAHLPHVYVMGAGHVGRALAELFQHLPVRCILIDSREEELVRCRADVETRLSAIPEVDIMNAPAGSAFVVLTHDHALDFLLTLAALEKGNAAYVGMIGSATKRAKFRNWVRQHGDDHSTGQLICPIGASGSRDKRPSVIAAFVAAEVIADLTSETAANSQQWDMGAPVPGNQTDRKDPAAKRARD
ncbi:xanthine dehydrogenase accessory factor [Aliiroseovarius sediminilitoris]|uniref:Xanthine dehydrogenase accessory factor n=1 Tax=Aliiroseovarius sediminilitoris TaxID=1173584 RepID=A0A1I0R5Z5_9RHOB|nr:xanthine dehydrogenase accessory protein XdhC [Aliiroseovarius sediminilitoris]SEW35881.1 xanthine dehydrogenase accessory factor [Aliiroseovarius sediminilitoris]